VGGGGGKRDIVVGWGLKGLQANMLKKGLRVPPTDGNPYGGMSMLQIVITDNNKPRAKLGYWVKKGEKTIARRWDPSLQGGSRGRILTKDVNK